MPEKSLADQLLDAQVDWVVDQLTGPDAATNLARDVDDLLAFAGSMPLADLVEPAAVKDVARHLVATIGAGPLVGATVGSIADAVYDLDAGGDHRLGDVVDREPVEALIEKLLEMDQLHDRFLDRMNRSPLVAGMTARFVTVLVSDFVAQNRARAEKLPGVGGMIKLGVGVANKAKSPFDKQLEGLLGEATSKGTQAAIKTANRGVKDLLDDAPLREAVLEVWDLHADEPVSDLREYLSKQDLRELALLVHDVVQSTRDSEFTGHVVDAVVDALFAAHGARSATELLGELGVTRDRIVADVHRLVPPLLDRAKSSGELEAAARTRLAPFFASDAVQQLLA